uniref:DUF2528 family protein n=1 Tax=Globodera pallida TaxID=36090 RepID=A0A183CK76_GLOPA
MSGKWMFFMMVGIITFFSLCLNVLAKDYVKNAFEANTDVHAAAALVFKQQMGTVSIIVCGDSFEWTCYCEWNEIVALLTNSQDLEKGQCLLCTWYQDDLLQYDSTGQTQTSRFNWRSIEVNEKHAESTDHDADVDE